MDLQRLKWTFLLALACLLAFVEWARTPLEPYLGSWQGRLLLAVLVAMCVIFPVGAAFSLLSRMQERLERRNRELLSLDKAARDIHGEFSLQTVLQKVVDQARLLLEAHYGAISVLDEDGRVLRFLTSGVSDEVREKIGNPPQGRGVLGVPIVEGRPLRLRNIADHPKAVGMPAHHPQMTTLLAVPVSCKSAVRGNLYLADKTSGGEFLAEDEETLTRFAATAAVAIDNAYLHQKLRSVAVAEERFRIGREMHDGMAQVLAYVNTKVQAVGEYLRTGETTAAERQLSQLASAAREAYTDVREGILALRTQAGEDLSLAAALTQFFDQWQARSGIAGQLHIDGSLQLEPEIELQLLRITQEALTNVRKHAKAKSVAVRMGVEDGRIVTTIEDDGVGFDPDSPQRRQFPRFGLAIMRERTESIGGTMVVQSGKNSGTRVRIDVPHTGRAG